MPFAKRLFRDFSEHYELTDIKHEESCFSVNNDNSNLNLLSKRNSAAEKCLCKSHGDTSVTLLLQLSTLSHLAENLFAELQNELQAVFVRSQAINDKINSLTNVVSKLNSKSVNIRKLILHFYYY